MQVQGFSHVTINVSDLKAALRFYVGILTMKLINQGNRDAYLEWGSAWICIQERSDYTPQQQKQIGIDHIAFFLTEEHLDSAIQTLNEHHIRNCTRT